MAAVRSFLSFSIYKSYKCYSMTFIGDICLFINLDRKALIVQFITQNCIRYYVTCHHCIDIFSRLKSSISPAESYFTHYLLTFFSPTVTFFLLENVLLLSNLILRLFSENDLFLTKALLCFEIPVDV